MMTSANICHHVEFFFQETKDNMLVIIHAKFEVNSCCGWDYRQGVNLPPPPMHKRYLRHPMHNRVKKVGKILLNYRHSI